MTGLTWEGSPFRLRVTLRRTAVALAKAVRPTSRPTLRRPTRRISQRTLTRTIGAAAVTLTLLPCFVAAQGRVSSASPETRRVTQSLEREISALAGRRTDLWFAYRMATTPNARQLCGGSHVVLESSTAITVMGKIETGELRRLRVFTPECDVDAGSVPLVSLEGVSPDDSASWLTALVKSRENDRDWRARVADPALNGLTLQAGDGAVKSLIALARDDARPDVRGRALVSLGQRAGQLAASTITNAIDRDPEVEVKKTAVRALSQLPKDEGVPLLIQVARSNRTPEVRREAMLRLGQSNDARAVKFFEEILTR